MEFTNEILHDMNMKKRKYNIQYAQWYYGLGQEDPSRQEYFENKSERISNCMDLWQWDHYEKNKLLDLQRVNRCSNNRFCPNCKLLDISKFIHKFKDVYSELLTKGYKAYMLTLTIPSVPGTKLSDTIDKLNKDFRKLIEKFSYDDRKSYKDRYFQVYGGIRVLEITYNVKHGFHPHFHCVVFTKDEIDPVLLEKKIQGKYSRKRKEYNYKSLVDIQFGKLWSMIYYNLRLNKKNINSISYDPSEEFMFSDKKNLEVDFRELDEKGIYEVFKYTFKDSDIENFYVFKTLVNCLANKRIRQGFGILYNMQCEDIEEGEVQELDLEIKEDPTGLLTHQIAELITVYRNYKKISRFNRQIDYNIK